jgi:hypothetical protein
MEDLREIEAIKRLKYRYMRCLDEKRWDELAECLTEDATTAWADGRYRFEGRAAILGFLEQAMGRPTFLSSHRVHHPEIALTGPTTASGVWALEDRVIDLARETTLRGAGFYRDEYVKVDGAWRIRHTGYARTFEEIESRRDRPGLVLVSPADRGRGSGG